MKNGLSASGLSASDLLRMLWVGIMWQLVGQEEVMWVALMPGGVKTCLSASVALGWK
jgi:hypothetical protein